MAERSAPEAWLWPPLRLRLARALLDEEQPVTGAHLGAALGTYASNVNKHLVPLEAEGLVTLHRPDAAEPSVVGRPSRYWSLSDAQRAIASDLPDEPLTRAPPTTEAASNERTDEVDGSSDDARPPVTVVAELPTDASSAGLGAGQEIVVAEAGPERLLDLFAVLADAAPIDHAQWAALCNDEVWLAFGGAGRADAAIDLLAVLAGAGIPGRRTTVSGTWSASNFRALATRASRLRQQTKPAGLSKADPSTSHD